MRTIVAERDGYRCFYCRVPTAATIEHTEALSTSDAGARPSQLEKLRIACPFCNSAKGDEEIESFVAREGWKLDLPKDLPGDVKQMVRKHFRVPTDGETIPTGSTNSRLRFVKGVAVAEVRPHKSEPWQKIPLGPENHPKVVAACWLFLRRHNTAMVRKPV